MFAALKRFFSKPAAVEPPAIPTTLAPPAVAPVPVQFAPAKPAAPPPAPVTPPAAASRPTPTPLPPPGPIVANPEGAIVLSFAPILASLPPNLAALVASSETGTLSLPVKTALEQLASGAVRITFGELRQASPPGTFYDDATQDRSLVNLPLSQIVASLDPALLPRRPGRKVVAVPDSVTSIFGHGRTLRAPITAAPPPVRPSAPPSVPKPSAPEPGASHFTRPPVPGPLPTLAPKAPAPTPAKIPFTPPKAPAMPVPVKPVAEEEIVTVALSAISETWPPPLLQTIAEFQLQGATVSLPLNRLEPGLKAGRVVFTWGDLCQWLQPPPPANSSADPEVALELPLKVVAPLFMAQRRPATAPKKLASAANIASHIPELFSRTAASPPTFVSAPVAAPPAAPAPMSMPGGLFGLPEGFEWTPREFCQKICALEGVAGSALAMNDGLVVAAQLPPALKGETVAAFLPQIFGKVSQSAGEMQLEPVTCVVLSTGQARCAIYKTGKLYLAVLGHPGAALPEAMLGRIAAELAKRNP
jgi:predicted regulator of Ras-like GTPase activity (Roadblock/LC7/MglB family)